MSMNRPPATEEVWAVVDVNENVVFTRGGSSTSPKLMVYSNKKAAYRAEKWGPKLCRVKKIYPIEERV